MEFDGCNSGTVSYDILSLALVGDIPIERLALDNVPLCAIERQLFRWARKNAKNHVRTREAGKALFLDTLGFELRAKSRKVV